MIGKLKTMDVLIVGLRGLGIETAKNLILTGPRSVTVHDDEPAVIADVNTNFYIPESEVGKPRGQIVLKQLEELNPNVSVSLHTGPITKEFLSQFHVVVFTDDTPISKLKEYNEFCHNRKDKDGNPAPIVFLYGHIDGASAVLFSDFGPKHWVFDPDGTPDRTIVIDHISNAVEGCVHIDGDRHMLNEGDVIKIDEVRGMSDGLEPTNQRFGLKDKVTNINAQFVVKPDRKNPKKFYIGDTTGLKPYVGGGIATTVKQGKWIHHVSLSEALVNPTFLAGYVDFFKMGREISLHFARLAIWKFQEDKGRLPGLHDEKDADAVVSIAKEILAKHQKLVEEGKQAVVGELDESVIRKVALYYKAELSPMAALFGGVLAQEITKQTGKFTPMEGWFHFDAFELLDEKVPADAKPVGCRYDHQIAIFGKGFQDKLMKQSLFLVGCGALGCEYLKFIACTGLGVDGKIAITDDDRIELSNLNRQFLFRREHVGKSKSLSAAGAAIKMNPALAKSLKAHEIRVEPKTEDIFDDAFWEGLDFVLNALDNIQARKYTDSKCVFHLKPLFESGTLGTQANSVICLPHKTPCYSEGAVAGETQGVAQCTLRNFPFLDVHCIEWAREMFNEIFTSGPDAFNSLLDSKEKFYAKLAAARLEERSILETVKKWIDLAKAPTFETCLKLAIDQFTKHYRDMIQDLITNFPEDARVIDQATGADLGPFWHGHKRFPRVANFNPNDELHLDYVYAAANIFANVFNIPEVKDREEVRRRAAAIPIPAYVFKGTKIKLDDEKKEESKEEAPADVSDEDRKVIDEIRKYIDSLDLSKFKKLNAAEFEKDNDENHHIDWITAATNLRCYNYHIKQTTRANCRLVAGRIIPAIATTTAMITGFVGLEVFKYIKGVDLSAYRGATVNLGTNVFCVEQLPDPRRKKTGFDPETYMQCTAIPEGFTVWDKVEIRKPGLTLGQFIEEFKAVHHGAIITNLVTLNGKILYNDIGDAKEIAAAKVTPLIDLYTKQEGPVFPANRRYIQLVAAGLEDTEGNTAVCPIIVYYFK